MVCNCAVKVVLTSTSSSRCRDFLEDTFAAARTSGLPLSVVMLDVDHFKQVNDQHGHRVGDRVLQRLALALTTCLQPGDLAVRHGGEEFSIVLPGSDLAAAAHRAEVLRRACTLAVPLRDAMVHVTISVGVATLGAPRDGPRGAPRACRLGVVRGQAGGPRPSRCVGAVRAVLPTVRA